MKPTVCQRCGAPIYRVLSAVTGKAVAVEEAHVVGYAMEVSSVLGGEVPKGRPVIVRPTHACGSLSRKFGT